MRKQYRITINIIKRMKKIILICLALMTFTMGTQAQKRKSKSDAKKADTALTLRKADIAYIDSTEVMDTWGGNGAFPVHPTMYTIHTKTKTLLNTLIDHACVPDLAQVKQNTTPEGGNIIGTEFRLPFKVEHEATLLSQPNGWPVTIDTLLNALIDAFEYERGTAYSYGFVRAGSSNARFGTTTGNSMSTFKQIVPSQDYNYIYMEVKKPNNPTMREFYCVSWKQMDETMVGAFDFITSKRPDLIEQDEANAKATPNKGNLTDIIPSKVADKLAILERLADKYNSEITRLTTEYNSCNNYNLGEEIMEQITDYRKKLKEVVDKMHTIIMSEIQ